MRWIVSLPDKLLYSEGGLCSLELLLFAEGIHYIDVDCRGKENGIIN
jgi:hypothetical protein